MITVKIEADMDPSMPVDLVEKAGLAVLELSGVDADLTLVLTGNEPIRILNRDFRGVDSSTDVLSFPADEVDPDTGRRYLGDVIISVEQAEKQATTSGHPLTQEIQLLVIHGILHLLGHDHGDAPEKKRMWAAQAEALESLGIPASILHE